MPKEQEQPFYSRFKDKVISAAQERGSKTAAWDDVLSVATGFGETADVLRDKKVSAGGLQRDIRYSVNFGRPELDPSVLQQEPLSTTFRRATQELLRDADEFARSQSLLNSPGNAFAVTTYTYFLARYIEERQGLFDDSSAFDVNLMKQRILQFTMVGFLKQFSPVFPELPGEGLPEDLRELVPAINKQFTENVLEKFKDFCLSKGKVIMEDSRPILLFDALEAVEWKPEGITPFQIVDTAERVADPFLKYVLYRNGLRAPEGYEAPCSMPTPTVITHALAALQFVEENRQQHVGIKHLLPGLIKNPEVLKLLMDLDPEKNISERDDESPMDFLFGQRSEYRRNFIKFYNVVQSTLAPEQEGVDVFRFRPEITEELRAFLIKVEPTVAKGSRALSAARLFGEVLRQKDARAILLQAGLTAEQLKRWPKVLRDADKKKVKEETVVKDKAETAFKIDDKQLEDLLEEYGSERTKLALEGKLDPVIGREEEIRNMIRILLQRGKSNPLLLGEAGVGKTVLFDGLARQIASGNVPRSLIGARVIALDLSSMNSDAMFRGQFEGRLLPIVQGVAERNAKGDKPPIILCLDEIHAALMAGSAMGTPGAGELLKPPLSRGEISVVGATTQADYAKHIEPDSALNRRFEPIFIYPPNAEQTTTIIQGLLGTYAKHHGIEFSADLVPVLVRLTDRYLPNLNQPDKAISILDGSFAYARMHEKGAVDHGALIETIAATAKLDPKFLQENEGARFLKLKEDLPREVLGQVEAMQRIAGALIIAKADLHDPKKPLGQFLLMGPTGVGKTETARALARLLFGTEDALIRIDMENMREAHEDSRLFGAPPGYIGYGEEGELTGAVRRKPYAVVLLDEVEKAHPDVFKRLLPIFEEGEVKDGRNQTVSFRNTIILMSSNLGVSDAQDLYKKRYSFLKNQDVPWRKITHPAFEKAAKDHFSPEFLNRLDAQIIFDPLSPSVIHELVGREIAAVGKRLQDRWGLTLEIPEDVYEQLAKEGYNDEYGARYLKRTITTQLLTPLSSWLLEQEGELAPGNVINLGGLGNNLAPQVLGQ